MDAGVKIRELARMLGVTDDTVINWKVRIVSPNFRSIETIKAKNFSINFYPGSDTE